MDPCSRESLRLAEMDAMIARAEVICGLYLRAIEKRGRAPPFRRQRHLLWRRMDDILDRLRAQRSSFNEQSER
jgi:hypothetical protein